MTAFRVATLAFPLGGDAALVHEVTEGIDVAAYTEARNRANQPVDVRTILGDGWEVAQDTSSGARAGCALAVREGGDLERFRDFRLTQMNDANADVQARYLLHDVLRETRRRGLWRRRTHVLVFHLPTPDTGKQQEALRVVQRRVRRLRLLRRRWIALGDPNMTPADLAAAIGAAHFHGDRPMCIAWSGGWGEVATGKTRLAGSDHAVLTVRTRWRV